MFFLLQPPNLLSNEKGLLFSDKNKHDLVVLQTALTAFQTEVSQLQTHIADIIEAKQSVLKKQRASRQRFEDYREASWGGVMQQLIHVPLQCYQYLKTLVMKLLDYYLWEDSWPRALFWGILGLVVLFFGVMRRLLRQVTQEKTRSRFSGHLYDGALVLFLS